MLVGRETEAERLEEAAPRRGRRYARTLVQRHRHNCSQLSRLASLPATPPLPTPLPPDGFNWTAEHEDAATLTRSLGLKRLAGRSKRVDDCKREEWEGQWRVLEAR